jgi:hypothetical protein
VCWWADIPRRYQREQSSYSSVSIYAESKLHEALRMDGGCAPSAVSKAVAPPPTDTKTPRHPQLTNKTPRSDRDVWGSSALRCAPTCSSRSRSSLGATAS